MKLRHFFHQYLRPDDTGGTGGGAVDRGDDWTPTPDDGAADLKAAAAADASAGAGDTGAGADDADDAGDDGEEGKGADAKAKAKGKDPRIPLARHKEMLDKERGKREALERELAQLRTGKEVAKTHEVLAETEDKLVTMETEYLTLLEKGDVKGAAALMAQIRRTERSVIETKATAETQAAEARAYERVRYDTTVERLESAYPVINPDHDDYDKELTAEVVELRDGYIATGRYSRAEALQKACKTLLKTATTTQKAATEVTVRVSDEDVAKQLAADRKKDAVKKNLDTAGKQPPSLTAVGKDSDKAGGTLKSADVIKMTQKEFAKLDDGELARLRGDVVA